MMNLEAKLKSLGLSQYAPILHENGFEEWNTVLDITEEDLDSLGFKRGHRRLLQKEIANNRGFNSPSPTDAVRFSLPSTPSANVVTTVESFGKRTKRRYRWHPRTDPNAPKKPKTAYVNFADHLRSDNSVASLSFVDIAREVGRRWQSLNPAIKQDWEKKAAQAMQDYEDQMDAYRTTKQYQEYQEYLETFKKAPGKSARQKIKSNSSSSITSPRRSESSGPERSPSTSLGSPTLAFMEDSNREECRIAVNTAIADVSCFRRDHASDSTFSVHDLPPEEICRHAIKAVLESSATSSYIISLPEAELLLQRVYRLPGPLDALSLLELCAVAAVGAQSAPTSFPRRLRRQLFATICALLENLAIHETIYLRLMRVLLCLAMYSISEKHLSARSYIVAGLAIAKMKYPTMNQDTSHEDWTKVYRTLVFMECWLSQSLGYTTHNLDVHIRNAVEPVLNDSSPENAIQWHGVRIAIIGTEIASVTRRQGSMSPEAIRYFTNQLELWRRELPAEMQLETLMTSEAVGSRNGRSLLAVHICYFGALILLYGQPLAAAEESGRAVDSPELHQYRSMCLSAGEHISRLMKIMDCSPHWAPQSWLLLYWAFSACNILVLEAAQALRNRSTNDYDRLMSHALACIGTLENCAKDEPVAARYLDMMAPIYGALRRLRESPHIDLRRRKSEHKISINDLLASDDGGPASNTLERWKTIDDELPSLVRQVTQLLRDPFGRAQQDHAAGDQYPTPPSNADNLFWFRV